MASSDQQQSNEHHPEHRNGSWGTREAGEVRQPSTRGRRGPRTPSPRQEFLKLTAKETLDVLPSILSNLPQINAYESERMSLDQLLPLTKITCPTHEKIQIVVICEDTLNAAIMLQDSAAPSIDNTPTDTSNRVAVLSLASERKPGGGWLNGRMAQEESLCYRSSLSLSLHRHYYPLDKREGLYSRDVVVIRSSMRDGHVLSGPIVTAVDLPVFSVLTIAGIWHPKIAEARTLSGEVRQVFADASDRELTKDKMRLTLRMAALKGHNRLVLGALGCGVFKNPPWDVAEAWKEVLLEEEFSGGWWKAIWFAVLGDKDEGNYAVFDRILGGLEV